MLICWTCKHKLNRVHHTSWFSTCSTLDMTASIMILNTFCHLRCKRWHFRYLATPSCFVNQTLFMSPARTPPDRHKNKAVTTKWRCFLSSCFLIVLLVSTVAWMTTWRSWCLTKFNINYNEQLNFLNKGHGANRGCLYNMQRPDWHVEEKFV